MPKYPNFCAEAYPAESYQERSICDNWYLEANESSGAPTAFSLLPTPGFLLRTTVSQAPIRADFSIGGEAYFIAGFAFYELFFDGLTWTTLQRGTVNADGRPATICANGDAGDQLGITSGGVFYCYDRTTHALTVNGNPGTIATMGASIDGRFIYLDANTGTVYASALYDGTTWDPTLFLQSTAGDPWVSMCVTPDRLIRLFGETTGEVLADLGLPGFPFATIQEAFIPYGIAAPYAFTVDTSVTWLAKSSKGRGQIRRAQGYSPIRVSNHGIEHTIQRYGTVDDAIAFSYQGQGHPFAVFTFPTAGATWVTDEATGKWHGRSYWNTATGAAQAFRPGCAMEAFGQTLVGDRVTGSIYTMTGESFTDVDGAAIRRLRQPAPLSLDRKRYVVDSLELTMDVGVGLIPGAGSSGGSLSRRWRWPWASWSRPVHRTAGPVSVAARVGSDPQAMLRISRDGGKTFGTEHWTSMGPMGQYRTRVMWTRLGNCRSFVPQLVVSDPVPARVTDASISIRPEAA